jgi:tyrosinase
MLAETYPESQRSAYIEAAEKLRAPYWDWAENSNVPPVTTMSTVAVNIPNGAEVESATIRNPLFSFKIPSSAISQQFGPFNRIQETTRCPGFDGVSHPENANPSLSRQSLGLKSAVVGAPISPTREGPQLAASALVNPGKY